MDGIEDKRQDEVPIEKMSRDELMALREELRLYVVDKSKEIIVADTELTKAPGYVCSTISECDLVGVMLSFARDRLRKVLQALRQLDAEGMA